MKEIRVLLLKFLSLSIRLGRRSQAILVNLRNRTSALCHNAEALSGADRICGTGHGGIPHP